MEYNFTANGTQFNGMSNSTANNGTQFNGMGNFTANNGTQFNGMGNFTADNGTQFNGMGNFTADGTQFNGMGNGINTVTVNAASNGTVNGVTGDTERAYTTQTVARNGLAASAPHNGQPGDPQETARTMSALNAIPVWELNYADWLQVGMALKDGGYPCDVWDNWSMNDERYHAGECESKWQTFKDGANKVTVAKLFYLAGQRGWVWRGGRGNIPAATDAYTGKTADTCAPVTAETMAETAHTVKTVGSVATELTPTEETHASTTIPTEETHASTTIPDEEIYAWGDPTMCDDDSPAEALIHYLELLFRPEERVNTVVNAYRDADGKWKPRGRGDFSRTAGELIAALKAHPNDVGATVGDWEPEAGAWIRVNPVDGNGVKNENITAFRYALVESDSLSLGEQMEKLMELNLPVRTLVTSGGKSLHALVPVNAPDAETYANRVSFLYDVLEENGYPVDTQNRNPARLSRLPGVTRGKRGQGLLAENMGLGTWEEWEERMRQKRAAQAATGVTEPENGTTFEQGTAQAATGVTEPANGTTFEQGTAQAANGVTEPASGTSIEREAAQPLPPRGAAPVSSRPGLLADGLPPTECFGILKDALPKLPEELIGGILRQGHKMLIAGPSKAGKSFLLLELAVAIAEGIPWLGFPCKRGKVFYINLEIDRASCLHRLDDIYRAMNIPMTHANDIHLLNLRGHAEPLDQLVPGIIGRVKDGQYAAVIIDPIYKVIMGDENNASDMGNFCNQFDRIADATGASVIYCHHHSKGAQGAKKAMDRASGSGVFARDPDAQLDIVPLELTEHIKNWVRDGADTAWRMEGTLREFPSFKPVDFWFSHPLHRLDTDGALKDTHAEGSYEAAREKNKKWTTAETRLIELRNAYDICTIDPPVTVKAMADFLHITERSVRDRLREFDREFWYKGGYVGLNMPDPAEPAETPWEDAAEE